MADAPVQTDRPSARPAPSLALSGERVQALLIVAAILVHLAHQLAFRGWYIEDAAICISYARNIVEGEGIVPFRGGERIEGYSNPLWMLLLVGWQAVGIDGWVSSKIMAAVFGAATLPLTWLVAREALPDDRSRATAVLAPVLLAGSAHHAIWSASALENSLFNALLVLGAWLVLRENRTEARFPWSAVAFCALGLTRPEGVLYAAIAGFWVLVFALRDRRSVRPAMRWAATFWAPYLLFVAWRIWYFAWPLPNTYYAKLGGDSEPMLRYYSRGWDQIRQYAEQTWAGYYLPLLPLALLGRDGWRGKLAGAVTMVVCLSLLWPGPSAIRNVWFWPDLPEPRSWLMARIVLFAIVGFALPLLAIGGARGWRARVLTWHLAVCAIFFSIYSDGDWMRGLRWMSLFAPTQAILLAVGIDELVSLLPRFTGRRKWGTAGWLVATLVVALWFPPNLNFSRGYDGQKDDWPQLIKRRVAYTESFADRVFLEEEIRSLDMDMGAHMWWGDRRLVDMAGLIDIPMALHRYRQRAFVQEYVFDEQRPHFGYVHLRWAEISNFKTYPGWNDTYFKLRGYEDGPNYHNGVYARRDLVMTPSWEQDDREVTFARGARLHGFATPSPQVGRGRALYVETGFSTDFRRADNDPYTVTMFLSDGRGSLATWDLPLGYTVYPMDWWEPGEVFHGKFGVAVPGNLPEGKYDLGFVITGAKGFVLSAERTDLPAGAVVAESPASAHVAVGEVRFPAAIAVVSSERLDQLAEADRVEALKRARAGSCDDAEAAWLGARAHVVLNRPWWDQHRPEFAVAMSRCLTERARQTPGERVSLLARAHEWDHRNAEYVAFSEEVADELFAVGKAARRAEDWEAAYRAFADVLRIAPYYSWARRYAEEARDHRLGLHDEQPWGRSFGPW